jgi:DNA-binding transcriptional regulator GbsR (MarR family)
MSDGKMLEEKIYSTFSDVASSIGYSPLHGKIIGVLLVKGKEMSLQEIAKETGYSASMISLSLDLLELLGVIKRVKKTGDRNLYITLRGDLLECLKNAIILRVKKSIDSTLSDFEKNRIDMKGLKGDEKKKMLNTLDVLEKEIKRLEKYIDLLSGIKLP